MINQNLHRQPLAVDSALHRQHKLKLPITDWTVADKLNAIFVAAVEFGDVCREFPIVFVKAGKEADGSESIAPIAVLGLQQNQKSFIKKGSNRVILLTDGIANMDVTDPQSIAENARTFLNSGIQLSCIGVGQDLHQELLRDLARAGRGLVHFVGDDEDISKSFASEADSLLAPIANSDRLKVKFSDKVEQLKVYGYEPNRSKRGFSLQLDNLNCGATQVVIFELPRVQKMENVTATLDYVDAIGSNEQSKQIIANSADALTAADLPKNLAIALIAEGIQSAAGQLEKDNLKQAQRRLKNSMKRAKEVFSQADPDIERVSQISQKLSRDCQVSLEK